MKRVVWLFTAVLCFAISLYTEAQDNKMTGWLCDSKCIVQSGDHTTCNPQCTERSGSAVFIDDRGDTYQVANSSSWDQYMNKRVKGTATMDKDNPKMLNWRDLLQEEGFGGGAGGGGGH
jgi:hypothetical protein